MSQYVRVVKAGDEGFWYDREVGEVFAIEYEDHDRYWVREGPDRYLNFLMKDDAVKHYGFR